MYLLIQQTMRCFFTRGYTGSKGSKRAILSTLSAFTGLFAHVPEAKAGPEQPEPAWEGTSLEG